MLIYLLMCEDSKSCSTDRRKKVYFNNYFCSAQFSIHTGWRADLNSWNCQKDLCPLALSVRIRWKVLETDRETKPKPQQKPQKASKLAALQKTNWQTEFVLPYFLSWIPPPNPWSFRVIRVFPRCVRDFKVQYSQNLEGDRKWYWLCL